MASDSTITSPITGCGAIRWTSPELFFPEEFGFRSSCPTKESDCYALGMVIYEVLSGEVPFATTHLEFAVIVKVLEGERPKRPEGDSGKLFTNGIWEMLNLCWKSQPQDRINARNVLLVLEGDMSLLTPASNVDEDMEGNIHELSDATPLIAYGDNRLLKSSQMHSPKEGQFGNRLAYKAQKMLKATAKKLHGLRQA